MNLYSYPVVINTTFSSNKATEAGGGMHSEQSYPVVVGSIFWMNTAASNMQYGGSDSIYYSVVQGNTYTKAVPDVKGNNGDNPLLSSSLQSYDIYVDVLGFTNDAPVNTGIYVKRSKNRTSINPFGVDIYNFYFSINKMRWFTNPTMTIIDAPLDAIDLTATDATGYIRTGRPDAGAWEKP